MRTTRQIEAAEVHKVCAQSPVSVPTGPSSHLQICQGSRRTQTTLATLQHCKVVKVSQSSVRLGVILRITSTKQAPVLVGFTPIYIIADLDQETLPVPNPRPVKRPRPAVGSSARAPAATRADPTNSDVQA